MIDQGLLTDVVQLQFLRHQHLPVPRVDPELFRMSSRDNFFNKNCRDHNKLSIRPKRLYGLKSYKPSPQEYLQAALTHLYLSVVDDGRRMLSAHSLHSSDMAHCSAPRLVWYSSFTLGTTGPK